MKNPPIPTETEGKSLDPKTGEPPLSPKMLPEDPGPTEQ